MVNAATPSSSTTMVRSGSKPSTRQCESSQLTSTEVVIASTDGGLHQIAASWKQASTASSCRWLATQQATTCPGVTPRWRSSWASALAAV